jgi:hypothetical protein
MKTKMGGAAAGAFLLLAFFISGAMVNTVTANAATIKPHKVVLKNLTVDSFDPSAKTIAAHSGNTSYTIDASKATIRRASGEKARFSGFLEFFQNDSITVWGKTTNETNINASKIKNNSTRKTKGLYLGTIVSIASEEENLPGGIQGAVLMIKKNNQISEVLMYGYTKFRFRKHKITYADLKEGDVVTIRGIIRSFNESDEFYGLELVYNTTQIKVRRHGEAPQDIFPSTLQKAFRSLQ